MANASMQDSLSWLAGQWIRVDDSDSARQTYENWSQLENGSLAGIGTTLSGVDTVWKEELLIIKRNNVTQLEVTGANDSSAVIFKLTELHKQQVIFENPTHDFPKSISYRRKADSLFAIVSGDGQQIPFTFIKQ
ncbi:MAG: hypothetical protein ACI8QD_002277 [Cyclobacteriaceae bacterium]|jgi:hypothetical protein